MMVLKCICCYFFTRCKGSNFFRIFRKIGILILAAQFKGSKVQGFKSSKSETLELLNL
jgi:hypothetical protein